MMANFQPHNTAGGEAAPAPWGRVFTSAELAKEWRLSESSIRKIFADEGGVFSLASNGRRGKRSYQTIRIPQSVAERVWRERGGGGRAV
jgi:hypothetical protein